MVAFCQDERRRKMGFPNKFNAFPSVPQREVVIAAQPLEQIAKLQHKRDVGLCPQSGQRLADVLE